MTSTPKNDTTGSFRRVPTIGDLIREALDTGKSVRDLAADSGDVVKFQTFQELSNRDPKQFPKDPKTIAGMSRALGYPHATIVLAYAKGLGIPVETPSAFALRLPYGVDELDREMQTALVSVARAAVNQTGSDHDESDVSTSDSPTQPTQPPDTDGSWSPPPHPTSNSCSTDSPDSQHFPIPADAGRPDPPLKGKRHFEAVNPDAHRRSATHSRPRPGIRSSDRPPDRLTRGGRHPRNIEARSMILDDPRFRGSVHHAGGELRGSAYRANAVDNRIMPGRGRHSGDKSIRPLVRRLPDVAALDNRVKRFTEFVRDRMNRALGGMPGRIFMLSRRCI